MERINGIKKLTDNRFLNLYELDATFRDGSRAPYYVASRRKNTENIIFRFLWKTEDTNLFPELRLNRQMVLLMIFV